MYFIKRKTVNMEQTYLASFWTRKLPWISQLAINFANATETKSSNTQTKSNS